MDELIADYIYHMELGEMQEHKGMSVFPLYNSGDDSLYITLKEAMDANLLCVTEVDEHGSVPELKVINCQCPSFITGWGETHGCQAEPCFKHHHTP